MKRCPKCQQDKELGDFYRLATGRLGAYCKPCTKADVARWIRENPDRFRRNQRRSVLKREYGLTEADVDRMIVEQKGKCPICLTKITEENLAVDHDHATARVRGILCRRCNRTLGLLRDDPVVVRSAIRYLRRRRVPEASLF